MDVEFPAIEFR